MNLNKTNMCKLALLITFGIVLYLALNNLGAVWSALMLMLKIISPFIMGLCIAFVLSVPMRGIEGLLTLRKKPKGKKGFAFVRGVSLTLTFAIFVGVISLIMFLMIPNISQTFSSLADKIPEFYERSGKWFNDILEKYPQISSAAGDLQLDGVTVKNAIVSWLQGSAMSLLSSTFSTVTAAVSSIMNFIIGIIFAVYILSQKEKLGSQVRHLMQAFMPEKAVSSILRVTELSDRTFSGFLSGQFMEACLLGTMVFIVMSILRYPFALTISVIIGFTALIPIFGAVIGCGISALMLLVVDPMKAVWFIVIVLIIQQIEGNLIYPHVVGSSVGLPSIWVLLAVILGGSLMGVMGMLFFIPLCSVFYALLRDFVLRRLMEREKVKKDKV